MIEARVYLSIRIQHLTLWTSEGKTVFVEQASLHLKRRKEDIIGIGVRAGKTDMEISGGTFETWTKKDTEREVIKVCFKAIEKIAVLGVESSY